MQYWLSLVANMITANLCTKMHIISKVCEKDALNPHVAKRITSRLLARTSLWGINVILTLSIMNNI